MYALRCYTVGSHFPFLNPTKIVAFVARRLGNDCDCQSVSESGRYLACIDKPSFPRAEEGLRGTRGLGIRSPEQITASRARRSTNELRAGTFMTVLSTTVLEIIRAGSRVSH